MRWVISSLLIVSAAIGAIVATAPLALAARQELQKSREASRFRTRPDDVSRSQAHRRAGARRAGRKRVVDSMIEKGADVEKDDVPVLIAYLAKNMVPCPTVRARTSS